MKQPPLTADELRSLQQQYGSWAAASKATGRSQSQIRSRASVLGIRLRTNDADQGTTHHSTSTTPRTTVDTGEETASAEFIEATLDPNEMPSDNELLKRANLDPAIWKVERRRISAWEAQAAEGEVKTMRALRVSYCRIQETLSEGILPAFGGRPVIVRAPKRRPQNERSNELTIVLSDFHAPFHDKKLLDVTEQVLRETQPDRLIIDGDIVDWPSMGRHGKKTDDCWASANECIQAAGDILARLRAAVPEDCPVLFIPGNHDAWLSQYLYRQAGGLADLCVSGTDVRVWSLAHLLRLEELGIEMIGKEDRWEQSTFPLSKSLVVRHGASVKKRSGASVIANMEGGDFASITGHTHRQAVVSITRNDSRRKHKILQGAETGGMFQMPSKPTDWPTYLRHDGLDWQSGWVSVNMEPDGHYSIDCASWQNGVLMWQGRRWS